MSVSTYMLKNVWKMVGKMDNKRLSKKAPIKVTEYNDLRYREGEDKYHLLDIYRPQGVEGKLPVIIDIHGGGWMYGDKELNKYYCQSLCTRNFAVVNISYHLLPTVAMPEPIEDIFSAFNYVLECADKYGLDTENMFLTGDSAGGHYSAVACSIIADLALQKLYGVHSKIKFKGVGFTCAVFETSFITKLAFGLGKAWIRMFFDGRKDYENHPLYKSLNIVNNKLELFPAIFINSCYGDMCKKQAFNFSKILDNKGIAYTMDFIKKEDAVNKLMHVYSVSNPELPDGVATNDRLCAFFKTQIDRT